MPAIQFSRKVVPLGDDEEVTVLVGECEGQPCAVFMSYEAFLEIVGTLYTAVEMLRGGSDDLDEEFARLTLHLAG